jgi:hypothetical protein
VRNNAPVPVPVDPIRDSVDWILFAAQLLSLFGTLLAVFLAYRQIKQARMEAKAAQVAQLKERRVDFELTVLRELLIAANRGAAEYSRFRALASTLTPSVVPITRAAARLPTTADGERVAERVRETGDWAPALMDSLKDQVTYELVQAIAERVNERAPIG